MFIRTVKVPSSNGTVNEYVRIVESYREAGRVKQRTIADLGRKDVLARLLPQLERVLRGDSSEPGVDVPGVDVPGAEASQVEVLEAATWGPVLVVRALFDQLGLFPFVHEGSLGEMVSMGNRCLRGRKRDIGSARRWMRSEPAGVAPRTSSTRRERQHAEPQKPSPPP